MGAADRLKSAHDEMARLQEKIAKETNAEARASERLARAAESLARTKSPSSVTSYRREMESQQREIVRRQKDRAKLSADLARKQRDAATYQRDFLREQQAEAGRTSALIKRLQEEGRGQQQQELHAAFASPTHLAGSGAVAYDAFISHASEDKDDVVRPLAQALTSLGHRIWFDELELKVGDSLRRSIDRGLANSRFGIVVLSPNFFAKNWPQYELDGLVVKETLGGKVILPLWHRVSKDDVVGYSPTLADRVALSTALFTIDELARELSAALHAG
jgi:hypothetical protein